jgi:hypothetical protein
MFFIICGGEFYAASEFSLTDYQKSHHIKYQVALASLSTSLNALAGIGIDPTLPVQALNGGLHARVLH